MTTLKKDGGLDLRLNIPVKIAFAFFLVKARPEDERMDGRNM
jgi:hypothetical protein